MRTTIDLPEGMLENAKRIAAERQITLSAVVQDALRMMMATKPPGRSKKFQLHTVRGRLVQPDLDLDRTSAILATEDEQEYRGEGGGPC